jgi:acyl carrier protein
LLNFLWGSSGSTLFTHENVHPETHRRLPDLWGPAPVSYYGQIRKMVWAERAVKFKTGAKYAVLPDDYLEAGQGIRTPMLLLTGADNGLWMDSNQRCAEALGPSGGEVTLEVIPGYGHNDIFIGRHAAFDVFPRLHRFLQAHAHAVAPVRREAAAGQSVHGRVVEVLASFLGRPVEEMQSDWPISRYGVDSVQAADLALELGKMFNRSVPLDMLLDLPSAEELARRLEPPKVAVAK